MAPPRSRDQTGGTLTTLDPEPPDHLEPRLAALRRLVADEVVPLEREMFRGGFPAVEPRLVALRGRVRDLELFAPHLPRAWGGAGLALPDLARVGEVLGWSPLGHYLCNCQAPDAGNMELLLRHGSEEQRQRWLAPLARGEVRSCFGMTEPGRPGSNPVWLATTARRDDGGGYVLDGCKWFTSGADGAAFCIVMAVTDPAAPPHQRASLLLVPTDAPGFERVRNLPVMGEAGAGWASHGEVRLSGVRVPVSQRIGDQGAGFALAQERLGPGRIHHCMRWIGICERAFDLMCRRAVGRELAPGEPLAGRQLVQAWVAESRVEIDAARLLVLRAAERLERQGAAAARDDVSLLKFHVAGVLQRVLDRSLQTHGAAGLLDETPLAFWWRHERGARIYDGPDEVHKTAVARRILASYARAEAARGEPGPGGGGPGAGGQEHGGPADGRPR
jgi:acyl-CoA dehydrogenase